MSFVLSIVFAVILFSLLIFVHELGHFIAAKLSGVQVNEFSMFMGPAIFKKQVGETLYSIRCIPIGGYCAMEGEDGDGDEENPRSFQKASWWKRLIILVAGSGMNFIAGVLIFCIVFSPYPTLPTPEISLIEEGSSLNAENGLQAGDRILEMDGETIYVQSDFTMLLQLKGGTVHNFVVERNGERVVLENVLVEPREFANEDGTTSLRYGLSFSVKQADIGDKLAYVWCTTLDTVRNVRLSLQMLVSGQAGLEDVSGPVGIVQIMTESAASAPDVLNALLNLLYFGGFIAVNLAIMNLLPIPALDGGRVVCLLITTAVEAVTRKKLNPKYEGYLHAGGMILLLLFMALVMFKDVFGIFMG